MPNFTDLPRELRDAIYKELFLIEDPVRLLIYDESCHIWDTDDDDNEDDEEEDPPMDDDSLLLAPYPDIWEEEEEDDAGSNDDGYPSGDMGIAWSPDSSDDGHDSHENHPQTQLLYLQSRPPPPTDPVPAERPVSSFDFLIPLDPARDYKDDSLVLFSVPRILNKPSSTYGLSKVAYKRETTDGFTREDYRRKNSLLLVNRQIGQEVSEYLYSNTRFVVGPEYISCYRDSSGKIFNNLLKSPRLRAADGVCVLNTFFDLIGPTNTGNIRHFWISQPGMEGWEFMGICIALHDHCPRLRTLKLADGHFHDHEYEERTERRRPGFLLSAPKPPPMDYFGFWEREDPEHLAEFYSELLKMFGFDRFLH